MNLRMKLILGALMVIIMTIVFATLGVSYLVRKQNDENGKSLVLKAVKFSTRTLDDLKNQSIRKISDFASSPTQMINFRYLLEIKDKKDSGAYKFIMEQPKEEMLSSLLAMVQENNFDGIQAFDGDGDLMVYLDRVDDHIEIGLQTTDDSGDRVLKYQYLGEGGSIGAIWFRKPPEGEFELRSRLPFPASPESGFGAIRDTLALTGSVPVIAKDLYLETKEKKIGCLKFHKFLRQAFAENLAKGTDLDVNIFTGKTLTAGTLKSAGILPQSALAAIGGKGIEKDPNRIIDVISIGEEEYYQTSIPLLLQNDYIGAIVLNLSRQDTLTKTRANIILLLLVMGICTSIVMPVAIFISGRLSNRIGNMLSVVKEFTGGNLSARIASSANDELGMLSLAFNQMARDLQRTMKELKNSEDTYRAIFENSGTSMIFIDEDTTISMCNKEFERLSGWAREEVEGRKSWTDFVARQDDLAWMKEYHRLRRVDPQGAPQAYESQFVDRAGRPRDIFITVVTMPGAKQSLAALVDITDRKQAEEERVRLVTAIEQAAEAIFITDTNWIIHYVNPAFEHMSGYDRDEVIGSDTRFLNSGRHKSDFYETIRDTLARGEVWSGHLTSKKKDGSLYETEATSSPVRDKQGTVISYVTIHRDITNEVKLEKELRQSQKMEAIGRLAGGIAHDFNNILAAIIGFTELARTKIPAGNPAQINLDQVLKAGSRAADLVGRILAFSRKTDVERKPVQTAPIITEALRLIRPSLPTTIEIRQYIEINPEEGWILADSTQIHQVLMNLCTNAAHAMRDKGGVLSVTISEIEADLSLVSRYPNLKPGPCLKLTVSDTGCGMDAGLLDRIFDPYFTTKGPREGTGMGLAVVQGIVNSHGGAISVYSEPGHGSSFHLFFPLIREKTTQCALAAAAVPTGCERVLFVDDEKDLAVLGEEMLVSLGYRVTATTSSTEALDTFRALPDAFDLVITDMTMPDITGKDLANQLLAIRADVPIILCTGFSEHINERLAAETGIRELLRKPYGLGSLARTIRRVLDEIKG